MPTARFVVGAAQLSVADCRVDDHYTATEHIKLCRWCQQAHTPSRRNPLRQTCGSRACVGHVVAMKRRTASYQAAGQIGGRRGSHTRRRRALARVTAGLGRPPSEAEWRAYRLGWRHCRNTLAMRIRFRKARAA